MATPRCMMRCGRCPNPATLTLRTTGKRVHAIDFSHPRCAITSYPSPKRTIVACDAHYDNLHRSAEMYGGTVHRIPATKKGN